MRFLVTIHLVVLPFAVFAQETSQTPIDVTAAIERGLKFLAKDAIAWKKEHNCVSCHHAALVVWSMQEGKQRGYAVDGPLLTDLTKWIAESGTGKFAMARPASAPNAASPKAIYFALSLGVDPHRDELSQKGLENLLETVKSEQTESGSWSTWPETRPPIFGPSDETLTLLATLALLPLAESDKTAKVAREKSIEWLSKTKTDDDPQSVALRLVLWTKLGRPVEEWQHLIERIKQRQNADGGWSQSKDMASDAWATGQALYALGQAGIKADDAAVRKAHTFLITAQQNDGSWPMASRPTKPGGKGAEYLIPITGAGSAWAVLGLVESSDPAK